MNPYQKAAVVLVRIAGFQLAFFGCSGILNYSFLRLIGQQPTAYTPDEWSISFLWSFVGIAMMLASKPLGRTLGIGLD